MISPSKPDSSTLLPPSDDDPTTETFDDDANADAQSPTATLADEPDAGEGGKLKMIIQIVKRSLGVKDLAAMRLSLPASLLEPIPNLEYWMYIDRPDLFAAINDSSDPFERMLAVLRFAFSKELKFIHGKVVKPYNSVLGEFFRGHWTVPPVTYPSDPSEPPICHTHLLEPIKEAPSSDTTSIKSARSWLGRKISATPIPNGVTVIESPSAGDILIANGSPPVEGTLSSGVSSISIGEEEPLKEVDEEDVPSGEQIRVVYLTEQVSHHPPISPWYATVPDRGVEASGVDQISARVAGTCIRIQPGDFNKGIFIKLTSGPGAGETYQISHPMAHVNGILRGTFYPTISESAVISCTRPDGSAGLRAVIEYKDESWIGKPLFLVEGVIHSCDRPPTPARSRSSSASGSIASSLKAGSNGVEEFVSWTKVRNVPTQRVLATFDGTWKKGIRWKRSAEPIYHPLVDLTSLAVIPKTVRPIPDMLPNESRRLWEHVTSNLISKNYSDATKLKQAIEQIQRDKASERKRKGVEFKPVYFEEDISTGAPTLTAAGRKAIEEEMKLKP